VRRNKKGADRPLFGHNTPLVKVWLTEYQTLRNHLCTMRGEDRGGMVQVPVFFRFSLPKALLVGGICFAAGGCAQFSEFSDPSTSLSPTPTAQTDILAPGPDPATVGSVARPAVLVDETTVPANGNTAAATSPAPRKPLTTSADAAPEPLPPAGYAETPKGDSKSRLLTPEEKAKVVSELEALAKSQSAGLGKSKKATGCPKDPAKTASDTADATGDTKC